MNVEGAVSVPIPVPEYKECATSDDKANGALADPEKALKSSKKKNNNKTGSGLKRTILGFFPILAWLPAYNFKENFIGDLIAGLTVGIMHVPQGMAYASLAMVPPINGLYSSFFASSFYMFFGTARHISIGCFAVASMMVGAVQLRLLPNAGDDSVNGTEIQGPLGDVTPLELTSALTLCVGIAQLLLAVSRLGFVTAYLSDPLISGFTTGSAVHVFMSQANKVFGVKMPRYSGMGMIIYMIRDIAADLPNTNLMVLGISAFGIAFLSIGRDFINPRVKKICPVPLPLELILVIIGTTFSVVMNVKEDYHIKVVDTIPRGFPEPSIPRVSLMLHLLADAIPIAVVCYIFIISMAKLFAKKHKYRVDSSQEMYACSFFSLLSSFFPVYPVGASLSRSAVCEMSGAKTLLYTVFSSCLLLTVILFLGPLLEPLPMCILACIVIVSLKSLFMQVTDLPRLWKISKHDFAVWMVACLATVLCNVTQGLMIAVAFAIISVVLREQWPAFSDIPHSSAKPLQLIPEHVKVLKFDAPLHFANVHRFIEVLTASIQEESAIIVDCSAVSYVDSMAVDAIKEVYLDAKRAEVSLYLAGLGESILQMLDAIDFYSTVPMATFQPCVAEAVHRLTGA